MTENQKTHRFRLIVLCEAVIVFFMALITIQDFVTGNIGYNLFSLVLLFSYSLSIVLAVITKGKGISNLFFCLTVSANFLISFYIRGNTGIGSIWLLVLPSLTMFIIGLSYGFFSSLFASICLIVLYAIPYTRNHLLELYDRSFLSRYTVLYFINFFFSSVIQYNRQTLRIKENSYQQELEAAVVDEHNKVVAISMQTIIAISNAVEAKNIHVGKHSQRVAHFSCLLAERLGWSEKEIQRLHTIAMLHDIGKIGVDSRILNKEDALDVEEFEKFKEHTTIGGKILKGLTIIPHVDLGANYHHEQFDGHGYPSGISGKDIPIEARIVAVADSFDAMKYTSASKHKMTSAQIKEEFLKMRGTHFDPELTDMFLQICEENEWFKDYEV